MGRHKDLHLLFLMFISLPFNSLLVFSYGRSGPLECLSFCFNKLKVQELIMRRLVESFVLINSAPIGASAGSYRDRKAILILDPIEA